MMEIGTKVQNVDDGRTGVVVRDNFGACSPNETPVVYDGETAFLGTGTNTLVSLGPENAVADLDKCGVGAGEDCCIFLTVGPSGACCERFSVMRDHLIFKRRTMNAKRHPSEPWPDCMNATTQPTE